MKKYILGLLTAFVALAAIAAAPGDAPQTPAGQPQVQAAADTEPVAPGVTTPVGTATTTTAGTTTPAATTASKKTDSGYLGPAIWTAVIGAIFAFLWSKGYLVKIRNYFAETQEELKKCSWPSRDELKGSTVVILVTTVLLGLFTVGVDWLLSNLIRLIT